MAKNKISIKQIAELAGTSVATVSRVINQNGRFSKETEEKILKIMKEYDYQPNYLAKSLRENKTNLIGVMIPDITNSFFAKVYRTIELALYESGYLPVLCDTNENVELENTYITNLNNLRFAGLICMNGTMHSFPQLSLSTLYLDRYPDHTSNEDIYFIGSDNIQGGYLAGKALIEAGKKRIGIVHHDKKIATQNDRFQGFVNSLKDYGYELSPEHIYKVQEVNFDSGFAITEKILENPSPCDGLFYTSDILAAGGLKCILQHDLSTPGDLAIIGMDDMPISNLYNLNTIRQETEELGKLAAKSIVDMIEGREVRKRQILDVTYIERGSV